MPETIGYQRFRARAQVLRQHIQLVDVAIVKLFRETRQRRGEDVSLLEAVDVEAEKYNELNHPVNHAPRIFNHSKALTYEHAIIHLYRAFSEYMKSILVELYSSDPLRVIGKAPQSIQYQEIVRLGSFDAISEKMVDDVFRKLENERSTLKLLNKILDHTGVEMPEPILDQAMAYLEMRHLFIHNEGCSDQRFAEKYGAIVQAREGERLPRSYHVVANAMEAIRILLETIDTQLIGAGLAAARR